MSYIRWTKEELDRLRDCFSSMSGEELALEFRPHTIASIRDKASKLGVRRAYRAWTTHEIKRLRLFYPVMPAARLEKEFSRSYQAIKGMAVLYGIRRLGRKDWKAVTELYTPVIFEGRS